MTIDLTIDTTTYRLSAFRSRQGWLGEWTDDAGGRSGVVSAASASDEEAIERAREEVLAIHRREPPPSRGLVSSEKPVSS